MARPPWCSAPRTGVPWCDCLPVPPSGVAGPEEAAMDSERLIPSLDLVHRVIAVDTAYTLARMRVLERIPGNPAGIAYRKEDNVMALMARHLPSLAFNRVVGLRR